jgi:hypothetical protein
MDLSGFHFLNRQLSISGLFRLDLSSEKQKPYIQLLLNLITICYYILSITKIQGGVDKGSFQKNNKNWGNGIIKERELIEGEICYVTGPC